MIAHTSKEKSMIQLHKGERWARFRKHSALCLYDTGEFDTPVHPCTCGNKGTFWQIVYGKAYRKGEI